MKALTILEKVRDKKELTKKELEFFAKGVVNKEIPDYQISAFTMAVYLNGLSEQNAIDLTDAYVKTGHIIKWPKKYQTVIVDKHSTGGVGDKISLVLIPILSALGLKSAKLSGKGLGQTGGTIDKLHSIKGFKTQISEKEFEKLVLKHNMAIIEANLDLAPADKKIYAIRDVTETVSSIPLIAASIMSKKIAGGSKNILIDLKVGSGAFMKDIKHATKLAKLMHKIANSLKRNFSIVISDMNQPLGFAIGNAIEVVEAINVLKLKEPVDVLELSMVLAAEELLLAKKAKTAAQAKKMVKEIMATQKPLEEFYKLIKDQGGDISVLKNLDKFAKAKYNKVIKFNQNGYVKSFDTNGIGLLAKDLGAGRAKITDKLDYKAGLYSYTKIGDKVSQGDTMFVLQSNKPIPSSLVTQAKKLCVITSKKIKAESLIKKIIR